MAEEGKGIALAILGVVAVIAIVGLVLMFAKMKASGAATAAGLYGGGGVEGHAYYVYSQDRLLRAGVDAPAGSIETVRGAWKTGGVAGQGQYIPTTLNINSNVPIDDCYTMSQQAGVGDPALKGYQGYIASVSYEQAIKQYGMDNCVKVLVNGQDLIGAYCCNPLA
jgi:hypothetical protein